MIKPTTVLFIFLLIVVPSIESKDTPLTKQGEPIVKIELTKEQKDSADSKSHKKYTEKRGKDYREYSRENRQLRRRVRQLERAVIQLQAAVFDLQYSIDSEATDEHYEHTPQPQYTCVLKTNFHGTYMGTGTTKLEAKGNAKIACEKKNRAIFCDGVTAMSCDSNAED